MDEDILQLIFAMKNSSLKNYIVPGLTSSLIGGGKFGKVRLFEASRHQNEFVTPHTHRFDFACLVLSGFVENTIWSRTDELNGDLYEISELTFESSFGSYYSEKRSRDFWTNRTFFYEGCWYHMDHTSYHSIKFSKDAIVLFFEGPKKTDSSYILEPVVDGVKISTFQVSNWMFKED